MLKKINNVITSKSLSNFIIYGFGQGINIVSPLMISPYIVYISGESGLGQIGIGLSLAFFLTLIVDYSFEIKGVKEVSNNRENGIKLNQLFNLILKSKIILLPISLLLGVILIQAIPFFKSLSVLMYLSMPIVVAQVFNPAWFLQGNENFKAISAINILSKLTYVALILVLIRSEEDCIYVNLILGSTSFFFNICGLVYLVRKYMISNLRTRLSEVMELLRNDLTFCMSQLFLSVRQLSPIWLIGFFMGYSSAGQYRVIEQIIMLFRTLLQVMLRFFYPTLCYKIVREKFLGLNYWRKYMLFNLVGVAVAVIILALNAEGVLLFFNLQSTEATRLAAVLKAGLLIPVLMVISLGLEQLMFALNKNAAYIRTTFLVTILNLFLMIVLIPLYELYGVVWSLISADIAFIISYYLVVRSTAGNLPIFVRLNFKSVAEKKTL